MNTIQDKSTALITGASRGLGLALARTFAGHGHALVLVASGENGLTDAVDAIAREFGVRPRMLVADLSAEGAAKRLYDQLQHEGVTVDILVNNAGIGSHGLFWESDPERLQRMMQLNMGTLTELSHWFVPGMVERGRGNVLNVASLTAFQPGGPQMAAYYATKAYVLSLSRGLRRELRGTGVNVAALCPGPMDTAFKQGDGFEEILLYKLPKSSLESVAKLAYRRLMQGRGVVIPGLLAKLLAVGGMLPPRRIAMEINHVLLTKYNRS